MVAVPAELNQPRRRAVPPEVAAEAARLELGDIAPEPAPAPAPHPQDDRARWMVKDAAARKSAYREHLARGTAPAAARPQEPPAPLPIPEHIPAPEETQVESVGGERRSKHPSLEELAFIRSQVQEVDPDEHEARVAAPRVDRQSRMAVGLRPIRVARGMTQMQLAQATALDQLTISRLETGKNPPSLSTATRLAAALKVDVMDLYEVSPTIPRLARRRRIHRSRRLM